MIGIPAVVACRGPSPAEPRFVRRPSAVWGAPSPPVWEWGRSPLRKGLALQTTSRRNARSLVRSKMVVPDLGGRSPESKAAENLHNFFTYLALRIVLTQLQAYNPEAYQELREFTESHPNGLKDGDQFCAQLMRVSDRHRSLALRIMEVRAAYSNEDFEWDNLQAIARKRTEEANRDLMCSFVVETSKFE